MKLLYRFFPVHNESLKVRLGFAIVILIATFHSSVQGYELEAMEYYPRLVEIEQYPDRVISRENGEIDFTLVQGDYINNGSRSMVRERFPTTLNRNEWVYYKFAVDISSGWPVNEIKDALIYQCRNGDGGPLFAIHLQGEKFYVRKASSPVEKYFSLADTESVNEFLLNAIWSEKENGRLIVQINGEEVLNYIGPTLHNNSLNFFMSFGLYRPKWNGMEADPNNKMSLQFTYFDFGRLDGANPAYQLAQVSEKSPPSPPSVRADL